MEGGRGVCACNETLKLVKAKKELEQHCHKDDEKKKAILYIACKQTCEEK